MDTIVTYHVEGDRDTPSGEVFAEQLDVLDQAWRGGPVTLRGVYLEVEAPPIVLQSVSTQKIM